MIVSTSRYRLKLFLLSLVLLVVAMAFTAGLNGAAFKKVYTGVVTSQVHVIGLDARIRLERALRLGKLLDKFVGLDKMLQKIAQRREIVEDVYVLSPSGALIADSSGNRQRRAYREAADFFISREGKGATSVAGVENPVFHDGQSRHLLFSLRNGQGELVGILGLRFAENIIENKIKQVTAAQAIVLFRILFVCSGLIGCGLLLFHAGKSGVGGRTTSRIDRRLYAYILLVVVAAQVFFSVHSAELFRRENQRAALKQVTTQTALVKQELEDRVLNRGIAVERLRGIEKRFVAILSANPVIDLMQLLDPDGNILNMVDNKGVVPGEQVVRQAPASVAPSSTAVVLPLYGKDHPDRPLGYLRATVSEATVGSRVREAFLDSLTVIVLSVLFLLEIKFVLEFFLHPKRGSGEDGEEMPAWSFARPAAFLLLFAWALPVSFIPLKMQLLYQPFFGLSKELVLGLPISMEMGCALVTALIAGSLTDRYGWHWPFLFGVILICFGSFFSGQTGSMFGFICYRGVVGLGYGLAWMGIQGFVFYNSNTTNRALGYSTLVAGIFSGHICGTAVGAMLAERFGYDPVFYVSAMLLPSAALFALLFMFRYMKRPPVVEHCESLRWQDLRDLLTDRRFAGVILLSVVPFSICQVGLLYYAVPLYLKQLGVSQSSIGRILMVYGLSVIFLAPLLSRLVDRSRHKGAYIFVGGVVGGCGLGSLYFFSGLVPVIAAVFTLGLSSCLAGSAQPALALNLETARKVGTGRSMALQRAADKFGQMGGPICIGMLVTSIGIEQAVGVAGLTFLGCSLLFALLVRDPAGGKTGN